MRQEIGVARTVTLADLDRLAAVPEGLQTKNRHFGRIILGVGFCHCADWPGLDLY
jgi:hypothetical protein